MRKHIHCHGHGIHDPGYVCTVAVKGLTSSCTWVSLESMRGPQREEMVYLLKNQGFVISWDFLIFLYNVTNIRNKTEIFE